MGLGRHGNGTGALSPIVAQSPTNSVSVGGRLLRRPCRLFTISQFKNVDKVSVQHLTNKIQKVSHKFPPHSFIAIEWEMAAGDRHGSMNSRPFCGAHLPQSNRSASPGRR